MTATRRLLPARFTSPLTPTHETRMRWPLAKPSTVRIRRPSRHGGRRRRATCSSLASSPSSSRRASISTRSGGAGRCLTTARRFPSVATSCNTWMYGRAAFNEAAGRFYDLATYHHALAALFGGEGWVQNWSYPPSFLIPAAPFGLLPICRRSHCGPPPASPLLRQSPSHASLTGLWPLPFSSHPPPFSPSFPVRSNSSPPLPLSSYSSTSNAVRFSPASSSAC